jgi:cytochrome c oxidase subunit II
VQRRRWTRVVRLSSLAGVALLTLSACSSSDVEKRLRFGWPTGVTKQAEKMRVLWTWSSVTALIVGIIVWTLIFWACGRYHRRSDEVPKQTRYNLPLEFTYTVIPVLIITGLFYFTVVTENYVNKTTKNPDVVIQVDAFKWNWQFEYRSHLDPATGQRVVDTYPGQTGSDGQPLPLSTVGSSTEIAVLVIPRGKTVRFIEHSEDVIHSFWVPEFLFKRDVIPWGTTSIERDNQFEITATSNGSFVGRCAELCGTYHSQMDFEVRVVDQATYLDYLNALRRIGPVDPARQSEALLASGQPPCATTTHPFNTSRGIRTASKPVSCT